MAEVTGRVVEVMVSVDYAWTLIESEEGLTEKVVIWSEVIEDYSPTQRIQHGMWVAMLRDAMVNNLTVHAFAPDFETMRSLSVRA